MNKHRILIDAGGTYIKMGLMTNGQLEKTSFIPSQSQNGLIDRLSHIKGIANQWLNAEKAEGIGIAFAGLVDFDKSSVISVNEKFNDTIGYDFTQWAQSEFGCPIVLENDARAALIGEWQYGAGKGSDNVAMLTLGTGIGGSAVINGNVLRGKHYQAGCLLGHFTIDYNGQCCNCGNIGCVETVGSSWALPQMVKNDAGYAQSGLAKEEVIDFEAIFRLSEQGDGLALRTREQCLRSWAAATVNAIHAYDPEVVVLGGGVMKSGDTILPFVKQYIDQYAWTPWGKVALKKAQLGNESALWGMNYLINEKTK
jgi:glucokinase